MSEISDYIPKNCSVFDELPTEMKILVYRMLDMRTFFKCREVSKSWKTIIDSLKDDALWKRFLYETYSTKYESYVKKTNLPYYKLFKNIFTWNYPTELMVSGCHETCSVIRDIHIYKENVILIYEDIVKYFTVDNLIEEYKTIEGNYCDFNENDYMFMSMTTEHQLSLHGKIRNDSPLSNEPNLLSVTENVITFKFVGDSVYYATSESCIWVAKWNRRNWTHKFLAKNQARTNINEITVYGEDIYIVTTYFKVYKVLLEERKLTHLYSSCISRMNGGPYMFDKCSLAYCIPNGVKAIEDVQPEANVPYIVLAKEQLSCILEHGDIIITAHSSGIIELFSMKHLLKIGAYKPMQFSTRPYVRHIKGMDVFEGQDGHYLYLVSNGTLLVYKFGVP